MFQQYLLPTYFTAQWFLINLFIYIVYVVSGKLGIEFTYYNGASLIWIPSGISVAAVFIFGLKVWPAIFLGIFTLGISLFSELNIGLFHQLLGNLACSLFNTLEAIIAYLTVFHLTNRKHPLKTVNNVIIFIAFAAVLAPLISALPGSLVYIYYEDNWQSFFIRFFNWWLGNMGGILLITPLLLNWDKTEISLFKPAKLIEFILLILLLFIIISVIFTGNYHFPKAIIFPYLIFFMFRFGRFETALMVLFLALFFLLRMNEPQNLFVNDMPDYPLIPYVFLMVLFSVSSLLIVAIITQYKQTKQELTKKNEELNRWLQLTLNREERNIELKKEINDLLKKLGLPKKYSS